MLSDEAAGVAAAAVEAFVTVSLTTFDVENIFLESIKFNQPKNLQL